jgi:hypothetical protein
MKPALHQRKAGYSQLLNHSGENRKTVTRMPLDNTLLLLRALALVRRAVRTAD